jgi:perosamine synthetase
LATSQLKKIGKLIELRRNNASYLSSKLKKLNDVIVPKEPIGYKHVYQLYSILLSSSKARDELMKSLSMKGIMSKVFFYPCHLTSFYKKLNLIGKNKLDVTENIAKRILTLPMYPELKRKELDYIVESITEFFDNNKNTI